jgi:PIN domain nuclease of toxin-antitoxin system
MSLLLDTHAFIWWDGSPERLGPVARRACLDPAQELVLSVASVWEMQIKAALGKLTPRKPLRELLEDQIRRNGLRVLPVPLEAVLRLETLPAHHKDPFDRLIVAQALVEGWSVVSHDPLIARYPVTVLW